MKQILLLLNLLLFGACAQALEANRSEPSGFGNIQLAGYSDDLAHSLDCAANNVGAAFRAITPTHCLWLFWISAYGYYMFDWADRSCESIPDGRLIKMPLCVVSWVSAFAAEGYLLVSMMSGASLYTPCARLGALLIISKILPSTGS